MNSYNSDKFASALKSAMNGRVLPNCPYCGNNQFTTTDSMATILIGKNIKGINLGPSIPSGMVICTKCGHIEFFALGALGLFTEEDGAADGK